MDLWTEIREEYVSTGTPYRILCEKHGVNLRTMARKAKKEEWQRLREERVNLLTKVSQQRAQKNAVRNAERDMDRMISATAKLMAKAEQLLELEEPLSPRDLRSLSATLLDVRTLLGLRDEDDKTEQQVRIEKMRAEIDAMHEDKGKEGQIEIVWTNNPWD